MTTPILRARMRTPVNAGRTGPEAGTAIAISAARGSRIGATNVRNGMDAAQVLGPVPTAPGAKVARRANAVRKFSSNRSP
jgi:hypothetical protein